MMRYQRKAAVIRFLTVFILVSSSAALGADGPTTRNGLVTEGESVSPTNLLAELDVMQQVNLLAEVDAMQQGSSEVALEPSLRSKVQARLAAARKDLEALVGAAATRPAREGWFDKSARPVAARLLGDLRAMLDPSAFKSLERATRVVGIQELLLFNGAGSFLDEEAELAGLKLTQAQIARIRPVLEEADATGSKLLQQMEKAGRCARPACPYFAGVGHAYPPDAPPPACHAHGRSTGGLGSLVPVGRRRWCGNAAFNETPERAGGRSALNDSQPGFCPA